MAASPHILFIPSWYPTTNDPTHGLFNKVFAAAAAVHCTVSVLYVCSEANLLPSPQVEKGLEDGIFTCRVRYKKVNNNSPFAVLQKRARLLDAYRVGFDQVVAAMGRPNLIQLNVVMPAGLGVLALVRQHRIPFVVNEGWSGYYPQDGNYRGWLLKFYTRKILREAKAILPVSTTLKEAMQHHGLRGHYQVVPNAVDTNLFKPSTPALHSGFRFIHISSLVDREKNVSGLLRAFAQALAQQPALDLHIVGDGPSRAEFEKMAQKLGIQQRVTFRGTLQGATLVQAINDSNALVMFSNYETFGITLIEALACGKPVLAARAGGVANELTPALGHVVEPGNEAALAAAMLLMAAGTPPFDPVVLREFVTARFTLEKVAAQLQRVYHTALTNL